MLAASFLETVDYHSIRGNQKLPSNPLYCFFIWNTGSCGLIGYEMSVFSRPGFHIAGIDGKRTGPVTTVAFWGYAILLPWFLRSAST